jgi:hypothetical protein
LPELQEAVRSGAVVTRIYEALLFKSSTTLWRSYIQRFYKTKTQHGKKPKDIQKFCSDLEEQFDVDLSPEDFEENPGAKQLSKMLLNNLW